MGLLGRPRTRRVGDSSCIARLSSARPTTRPLSDGMRFDRRPHASTNAALVVRAAFCFGISRYCSVATRILLAAVVNGRAKRLRKPRWSCKQCRVWLTRHVSDESNVAAERSLSTGRKFIHAKPNGVSVSLPTRSIRPLRDSWHAADCRVLGAVFSALLEHAMVRVIARQDHVAVYATSRRQEDETKKVGVLAGLTAPSGLFRVALRRIRGSTRRFTSSMPAPGVRTVNTGWRSGGSDARESRSWLCRLTRLALLCALCVNKSQFTLLPVRLLHVEGLFTP